MSLLDAGKYDCFALEIDDREGVSQEGEGSVGGISDSWVVVVAQDGVDGRSVGKRLEERAHHLDRFGPLSWVVSEITGHNKEVVVKGDELLLSGCGRAVSLAEVQIGDMGDP